MSPSTFEYIIDLVEQNMAKADTVFWKAVPIEKRAGVGLWRLSTGNSFRTISKVFGIGRSTVIKLVNELISELVWMSPEFIHFPKTTLEMGQKSETFAISLVVKSHKALEQLTGHTLKFWHLLLIAK